jgi:UDP-N-acetylmuramate dehydrogenase
MGYQMEYQTNRSLKELCTLGIGGPAKYFIEVKTIEQMQEVMRDCASRAWPFFILGKGSNCLFDDRGFDGLVILNKIDFLQHKEGLFEVGAGYSFSYLGVQTARWGWGGLEFACGIPGSVGGAVFMNAGANSQETANVLHEVTVVNQLGECIVTPRSELAYAYRSSPFQKQQVAIVAAAFLLQPSKEAREKQLQLLSYRKKTQPYSDQSAGCWFRNPNCGGAVTGAGAVIDQSGLKGMSVGDAQVSDVHANFIVNKGAATAQDVLALVRQVKQSVKVKQGIDLVEEVRYIPYELA